MTNRPPTHEAMPASDKLVEQVYDVVNAQRTEQARAAVARAAALAAEHRAKQLAKKETK